MRLKSANIIGFHEYSSSNNNMAMNALKFKPIISIQYKITENSSLQNAKIQKHERKRRKARTTKK